VNANDGARRRRRSRRTFGRRKPICLGGALAAAAGWSTLFFAPLPLSAFTVVAAVTSFACGAVVVAFAYAKESVPVRFLGTISGAVNVGNMLGPTLLQPAIGWMLDRRWTGAIANGARVLRGGVSVCVHHDRGVGGTLRGSHRAHEGDALPADGVNERSGHSAPSALSAVRPMNLRCAYAAGRCARRKEWI
jgi:hypothetical protein